MRLLVFNYDNYVYYWPNHMTSVTAARINRLLHQLGTPFSQSVSIFEGYLRNLTANFGSLTDG